MNHATYLSRDEEETFREREEFAYFPLDVNKRVIRLSNPPTTSLRHRTEERTLRLMLYVSIRIVSMRNVRRLVTWVTFIASLVYLV